MGQRGHCLEQGIIFFFYAKEIKIVNWEQEFFYTTEQC